MIHELHCDIQELEYRNALQDEDIQIKQLELQVSRQREESASEERKHAITSKHACDIDNTS